MPDRASPISRMAAWPLVAANRGRAPMVKAQWAAVEELRRSLPMVAKALSQIISERRRQGVALFRKFVEAQEGARHG